MADLNSLKETFLKALAFESSQRANYAFISQQCTDGDCYGRKWEGFTLNQIPPVAFALAGWNDAIRIRVKAEKNYNDYVNGMNQASIQAPFIALAKEENLPYVIGGMVLIVLIIVGYIYFKRK